jgi:Lar family restriction alleviation protein
MSTSNVKPLPCPFCGNPSIQTKEDTPAEGNEGREWFCYCNDCGGCIDGTDKASALDAWNSRVVSGVFKLVPDE